MRRDIEVLVVNELLGSRATPHLSPGVDEGSKLEIVALFTDASATLAALRMAAQLGRGLDARINLVASQGVPYPLELAGPPVAIDWLEETLCELASKSAVDTHVDIILSRDTQRTLRRVLRPHSLVVIGSRRRWWRTKEQRLAERLRNDGHQVIVAYLQ